MSANIDAIIARARAAAESDGGKEAPANDERERLRKIAAEFESMLMVQVLRDMRNAGQWEEEGGEDDGGFQSLFETLDVELASHLARAQGFGLTNQLMAMFDRTMVGKDSGPDSAAGNDIVAAALAGAVTGTRVSPATAPVVEASSVAAAIADPAVPTVTSDFGWRRDPISGRTKFHKGVDLRAAYGQEVQAAASGRVVFSGNQGDYGTTVLLEHSDGRRTRYAHLSQALVTEGTTVSEGQAIGRAGNSGRSTGAHLHFEVLDTDGKPLDPRLNRVS